MHLMDLNLQNLNFIKHFLESAENDKSPFSQCLISTVVQFIFNCFYEMSDDIDGWITLEDIIDLQINQLRKSIVKLNECKQNLTKEMSIQ